MAALSAYRMAYKARSDMLLVQNADLTHHCGLQVSSQLRSDMGMGVRKSLKYRMNDPNKITLSAGHERVLWCASEAGVEFNTSPLLPGVSESRFIRDPNDFKGQRPRAQADEDAQKALPGPPGTEEASMEELPEPKIAPRSMRAAPPKRDNKNLRLKQKRYQGDDRGMMSLSPRRQSR